MLNGPPSMKHVRLLSQLGYQPGGLPYYWMDEQSGRLSSAIRKFTFYMADGGAPPTRNELAIVADYIEYVVKAPCWQGIPKWLPQRAEELPPDAAVINAFLGTCLQLGLDPL